MSILPRMKNLIILSIVIVALLSGCSNNDGSIQTVGISKSECPKQGIFQSDEEYCIELCMFGKTAIATSCESMCAQAARMDGDYSSNVMDKKIRGFKCTRCGDCTAEQLTKIEEQKKVETDAKLAYNKSIEEAKKQKEEEQRIKEEKLKIQEQQKLELEKNITLQSEKLGGYVYIKNTSGEPRQYQEKGVIYDFPLQESIKVPVEIGRKLLATNQFELVIM